MTPGHPHVGFFDACLVDLYRPSVGAPVALNFLPETHIVPLPEPQRLHVIPVGP